MSKVFIKNFYFKPMIKKRLSKISNEILWCFTDMGGILKNWMLDPYHGLDYGPSGKPKKYSTLYNLKHNGYLQDRKIKNERYYKLTKKGQLAARLLILEKHIKDKKWDKKWYVLIFDIPEKKRSYRDNLTKILKNIGFYQLQKSVWIFPYDVVGYLYEILPGFREGDWFEYLIVNKISSHDKLIKYFDL
jgi:phenylacetic acid degradation operon negative regulatory protein